MVIKVDLEKTYDRLDWDFLANTLKEIGVSNRLRSLISNCVSLFSMKVMWNGQPLNTFNLTRGIH